jgi:hypothetical protein
MLTIIIKKKIINKNGDVTMNRNDFVNGMKKLMTNYGLSKSQAYSEMKKRSLDQKYKTTKKKIIKPIYKPYTFLQNGKKKTISKLGWDRVDINKNGKFEDMMGTQYPTYRMAAEANEDIWYYHL